MYFALGLICFAAFVLLILALIVGQDQKKKKTELLDKLKPLNDRVDIAKIGRHLRTKSIKYSELYVDAVLSKYSLLDWLEMEKELIHNYEDLISEIVSLDPQLLLPKIASIRNQIERVKYLDEKYGDEIAQRLLDHDYFLGMTEEQLLDCKGKPTKIEREVLKTKTKIIYIYGNKSSGDVFTFVNGELERFQDR